jgi:hypothetical protein
MDHNPLWHAKDRFPDVRKRVGSLKAARETQQFQTQHNSLYYISTWLQIEFLYLSHIFLDINVIPLT